MRAISFQLLPMIGLSMVLIYQCGCNGIPTQVSDKPASQEHHSLELTSANFDAEVLNSGQVVLVDFWAPWCGPCVALGPTIEELASDYKGKAVIGKLNVDNAKDIARQYDISGIPALVFFKSGEEVDRIVGGTSKEKISEKLDGLIRG